MLAWKISTCAPARHHRAVFTKLIAGDRIDHDEKLLIIGPTGLGKSCIACALGHKACRDDRSVQHHRVPRLFEALALARGEGRYGRQLKTISRVNCCARRLGLAVLNPPERRDLLEILEAPRSRVHIVTSQFPVDQWHGDPTLGDAILDRLVHNAHRLQLTGESMRKQNARNRTLDEAATPRTNQKVGKRGRS
ncbi:ATP-binding protein [Tardiphaga sp. 866_E4_N2_1]|uniref:ATP-binding protein n=1 Tax=unclassified Tardiphaga TaxID=2631404 RepID=UPI003F1E9F4F